MKALPFLRPAETGAHSKVTGPKAVKYRVEGCWGKYGFVASSSGHFEALFHLEFLPMLLKCPLNQLECLVLISSISYKQTSGGSQTVVG